MAERDADGDYSRRDLLSRRTASAGLRWCLDLVRETRRAAAAALAAADAPRPVRGPAMPPPERSGRPPLRPPRARAEERFLALCSRCGACIQACPYGALVPVPPGDPAGQDTPMIDPLERGCEVCADTPCVAACPTGALHPDLPLCMGSARITGHCLNLHDHPCRECHEQCPVPGAIELIDGVPRVVPSVCVGCGICSQVCPAPINAVIIMPAPDRPDGP